MVDTHPASFLGDSKGAEKHSHPSHSIPFAAASLLRKVATSMVLLTQVLCVSSIKGAYLHPLPSQRASALTFGVWHL